MRVVEVPRSASAWPSWPSLAERQSYATAAVDIDACVELLDALAERVRRKTIDQRVRAAAFRLLDALVNQGPKGQSAVHPEGRDGWLPTTATEVAIDKFLFGDSR